jgi:hypothetical protein
MTGSAKQSIYQAKKKWIASSQVLLAMTLAGWGKVHFARCGSQPDVMRQINPSGKISLFPKPETPL